MPYLIDGNNLAGAAFSMDPGDPRSRRGIVSRLAAFGKYKRSKIILVFDGPFDSELYDIQPETDSFSIRFPGPERSADDFIKELITGRKDRKDLTVVSSDTEIRDFARRFGVKSLSSREFDQKLQEVLRKYRRKMEGKREADSLSELEIEQWMKIFDSHEK